MSDSTRRVEVWTSIHAADFFDTFLREFRRDPKTPNVKGWGYLSETEQSVTATSGGPAWSDAESIDVGRPPDIGLLIRDDWIDRDGRRTQLREMGAFEELARLSSEQEIEEGNARFLARLINDDRNSHGMLIEQWADACILFWSPEAVFRVDSEGEWYDIYEERLARISQEFWRALEPLLLGAGRKICRRKFQRGWSSDATREHRLSAD